MSKGVLLISQVQLIGVLGEARCIEYTCINRCMRLAGHVSIVDLSARGRLGRSMQEPRKSTLAHGPAFSVLSHEATIESNPKSGWLVYRSSVGCQLLLFVP